jgi:hypothetical protein
MYKGPASVIARRAFWRTDMRSRSRSRQVAQQPLPKENAAIQHQQSPLAVLPASHGWQDRVPYLAQIPGPAHSPFYTAAIHD